jgi:hypothetical protein
MSDPPVNPLQQADALARRQAFLWVAGQEWQEAHRWQRRGGWLVAFVAGFAAGFLCHGWLP